MMICKQSSCINAGISMSNLVRPRNVRQIVTESISSKASIGTSVMHSVFKSLLTTVLFIPLVSNPKETVNDFNFDFLRLVKTEGLATTGASGSQDRSSSKDVRFVHFFSKEIINSSTNHGVAWIGNNHLIVSSCLWRAKNSIAS